SWRSRGWLFLYADRVREPGGVEMLTVKSPTVWTLLLPSCVLCHALVSSDAVAQSAGGQACATVFECAKIAVEHAQAAQKSADQSVAIIGTFREELLQLKTDLKKVQEKLQVGLEFAATDPYPFTTEFTPAPIPNAQGAKFSALTKAQITHDQTAGIGWCKVFKQKDVWMMQSSGNGYATCEVTCWK